MNKISYIIFDFDGTLADTLQLGIKVSNKLAKKFNYKIITQDKLEYYRGRTAQQILKEAEIPFYKFPFVVANFRKEINKIIEQLKPFNKIPEIIIELSKKYKLGILTSNSQNNVESFLKTNKLSNLFDFVRCQSKLMRKSKSLKKIMSTFNLKTENIVYIGDETRDIDACHKVGIKVIAVSWGFNTKKILSQFSPEYLIDRPEDILKLL